ADHVDEAPVDTDFFPGLAQGRCDRVAVGGFDAATWKTDLARMMMQVRGTPREQHVQARFALDQRHQDRRLASLDMQSPARIESLREQRFDPPVDRTLECPANV